MGKLTAKKGIQIERLECRREYWDLKHKERPESCHYQALENWFRVRIEYLKRPEIRPLKPKKLKKWLKRGMKDQEMYENYYGTRW